MAPIEAARRTMEYNGARQVRDALARDRRFNLSPETILDVFDSPKNLKVEIPQEPESVLGGQRTVLAKVTHTLPLVGASLLDLLPEVQVGASLLDLLPEVQGDLRTAGSLEPRFKDKALIFGLFGIHDVRDLCSPPLISLILREAGPTRVILARIPGEFVFEGFKRDKPDQLTNLRQAVLALGVLPEEVLKTALGENRFLLAVRQLGTGEKVDGERVFLVSRRLEKATVESVFSWDLELKLDSTGGKKEENTPVVQFSYH